MNIQKIMSAPPVTCRVGDTLNTAAQLMWEHDCGAIPVLGEDGSLAGIVTDRDICMAAYTQGAPLGHISVDSAMATDVHACSPEDTIDAVERLMSNEQVRRVPVLDEERRPVGLVSLNDIARHTAGSKKNGIDRELIQTLAAIGQPHREAPEKKRSSRRGQTARA